jgi:hypothetical protein
MNKYATNNLSFLMYRYSRQISPPLLIPFRSHLPVDITGLLAMKSFS